MLRFFIAGIMQGSRPDGIHGQDYRYRLRQILDAGFPDAEVFCPFEGHPQSVSYSDERGRNVFTDLIERASQADVLVAYLPEASMGTAVEMWEAFQKGRLVVAISPLRKNWVVKFLTHKICADLAEFEELVVSGELRRLIDERRGQA